MGEREAVAVSNEEFEIQDRYIEALKGLDFGKGKKYHVITYGCPMYVVRHFSFAN